MSIIKSPKENFWKLGVLDKFLIGHEGYVAGGCFKNILSNEKPRDIDVFFKSKEDFDKGLSVYESNENFSKVYENENAVGFKYKNQMIELCKKQFLSINDMLSIYDFTIVKAAYTLEDGEHFFYRSHRFFEDLHQKRCVIDGEIILPANTFERSLKYSRYGYSLCKESKLKLIDAIRGLSEDFDVSNSLYGGLD